MQRFKTNDQCAICYQDIGPKDAQPLILVRLPPIPQPYRSHFPILYFYSYPPFQIHGFTGSSEVWKRNIPALSQKYRVIAPDLRGHGESDTTTYGYHVARLAMDLKEMIDHLKLSHGQIKVIAGSLGCAIIWSVMKPLASQCFCCVVITKTQDTGHTPNSSTAQHSRTSCLWTRRRCRTTLPMAPGELNSVTNHATPLLRWHIFKLSLIIDPTISITVPSMHV
jgi:hypothetical protein